ncbi:dsDNA nuclease domain-containing protein [Pseudaminobacter sp. NGMCC 1.201702]|uniref:dsDNA nuclease domain-containing protein n=1 Tax=Pseudaminobacter sp. NGMCC 1.201702 TaxID=3391825 RepID=UPI0039EF46DC
MDNADVSIFEGGSWIIVLNRRTHQVQPSQEKGRVSNNLSIIAASTDAGGGIAARKGFRIQDHVAARLALEMLHDSTILQLECETGDDVVLRRIEAGQTIIEYVQVKTTEIDAKWSIKELTARVDNKQGSSVCEKSLLCDKHGEIAWFRFVTTRAVSAKLQPFRRPRVKRAGYSALAGLVTSFSKKFKTVKSASGRTLADWASNMLWEVEGEEDALRSRNINALLKLSSSQGVNPSYEAMEEVYRQLADKVRAMGDKPSVDANEKVWTRRDCLEWFASQVDTIRTAASATVKVYQISNVPQFFSEICSMDEVGIQRALYAYDVEFDGDLWRKDELIDHLLDWLPEIALPPQTLANFNHLAARRLAALCRTLVRHGDLATGC